MYYIVYHYWILLVNRDGTVSDWVLKKDSANFESDAFL